MTFVSYEFLAFLAVFVLVYYVLPGRFRWMILLAGSLLFYLASGVKYFVFLLITCISVYGLALWIEQIHTAGTEEIKKQGLKGEEKKAFRAGIKKRQKGVLQLGLFVNLGILIVVKYTNFAIWNVNQWLHFFGREGELGFVTWALPLGISYYTLQALGYILDIYHGKYKAWRNPFQILLFLSFFPQVVQGPVSRFDKLKETLFANHPWSRQQVCRGMERMLWGFFKKLVVADRVAPVVMAIGQNPEELGGIYVLVGMLAYTLQLYGDFTGGIDIAIGCGELFGVELPENFDRPFSAESLAEYWRRWHMSLMQWFREYVFYPLAGSRFANRSRKIGEKVLGKKAASKLPMYIASLITWFLTGIWHGASWNFVIWGMVNGVILLASQEAAPLYRKFHKKYAFSNTPVYHRFMVLRTLMMVSAVQMFEYYASPLTAIRMFGDLIFVWDVGRLFDGSAALLGITLADCAVLLLSVPLFCMVGSIQGKEDVRLWMERKSGLVRFLVWFGLFLAVVILGVYGQGYDKQSFIYNQF